MHHEYAVEPRVMGSSWETFRYLIEKFGFDKGRLISEFPRKGWFREVYAAADGLLPTQKSRLQILLNDARGTKVIRSGRPYDNSIEWFSNALTEHNRLPFHAIITSDHSAGNDFVIAVAEMDETHPLMLAPGSAAIPRDAVSLASAFSALLVYGSSILVVDPFYNPFNQRYKDALRECLRILQQQNPDAVCEIHYRFHPDAPAPEDIEREARHIFPGVIPTGVMIKVFCWKEKDGGADFHARYLLTDKGGIGVDAGFSAEGGHQTTDMNRLDTAFCKERKEAFDKAATVYDLVEPVLMITATGQVTHV